jgi:RNA polymerase sigma-70 factor (sigma-E family)
VADRSFEEFVHAQVGPLHRYALVLTGNRHAADDLLQDTLVRLAGAWRRVSDADNPVGYATTVMFRTHISTWRKHRNAPQPSESIESTRSIAGATQSDPFASVDERLALRAALATLPRLQRAVLVATYLNDHTDEEIAVLIGRRPATVRSLRRRGLAALRQDVKIIGLIRQGVDHG